MESLKGISAQPVYSGLGIDIARDFLVPALRVSVTYDRIAAYFNLSSLVSIGAGLEGLREKRGHMRLLMGAHDVDHEILGALEMMSATERLERLRKRLIEGVTSLEDELERSRVETVAWMLKDGLLQLKCATPIVPTGRGGIFHQKRLIFRDSDGNVITAVGSANETSSGLGSNFEELTVLNSWDTRTYTDKHVELFEAAWENRVDNLDVQAIDESFGAELLDALTPRRDKRRRSPSAESGLVLDVLRNSPCFAPMNSSDRPLFPHQERVLTEVTSRWPIRAVIADEVGLGKTYEAASVISVALRLLGVDSVAILPPASLLLQWQQEMSDAFGLDFWVYDNRRREYVSSTGDVRSAPNGPFAAEYPSLSIVSRDLVRGNKRNGHAFEDASQLPDMLVLDEAHAARKSRGLSGETRDTLLRRVMAEVVPKVPHVLFLTATPLQVNSDELFDLLELLGVPKRFDLQAYQRSLQLLGTSVHEEPDLSDVLDSMRIVGSSVEDYSPRYHGLNPELAGLFTKVESDSGRLPPMRTLLRGKALWSELHSALIELHPAAMMSVRNTRASLEQVGYRFPERVFESVEAASSDGVLHTLRAFDKYLERELGSIESVLYPKKQSAVGLVKITYRQRIASSLTAAHDTLAKRRARVQRLIDEGIWGDLVIGEPEEVELDEAAADAEGAQLRRVELTPHLTHACRIELAQLDWLLSNLTSLQPSIVEADPKMELTMKRVRAFLAERRPVLVFSRFTSTVQSLVESYKLEFGADAPYAVYTGAGGLVRIGGHEERGSKKIVTSALTSGRVGIVFCSDAASEGLNLQTANVLINVDVPWNPARLEQRIGRIARLGQQSPIATIINLWYPDSVEAKIYARVLERKDTAEIALGAFPDIVGGAIRNAVRNKFVGPEIQVDVVEELRRARESIGLKALRRVWSSPAERHKTIGTGKVRARLLTVLVEIARRQSDWRVSDEEVAYSIHGPNVVERVVDTVDSESGFTLRSRWVSDLLTDATIDSGLTSSGEFGVLRRDGVPLVFAWRDSGWIRAIRPDAVPEVLEALYLGKPLDLDSVTFLEFRDGDDVNLDTAFVRGWWPSPASMTVPVSSDHIDEPEPPNWSLPHISPVFDGLISGLKDAEQAKNWHM